MKRRVRSSTDTPRPTATHAAWCADEDGRWRVMPIAMAKYMCETKERLLLRKPRSCMTG